MGLNNNIKTINFIPFRRQEAGLTLIELVVTMVITSIVGLGIVAQFVTEQNFRTMIRDRIAISREARTAMAHMTKTLRFAKPVTITASYYIDATIEGGHIGIVGSDMNIRYARTVGNILQYIENRGEFNETAFDLAEYITAIDSAWNPPYIKIKLTARKGTLSITVESKVRVLPN